MNVIFIAMEFAPINLAGIYRPLRFANALAMRGIKPLVVTFDIDENLLKAQSKIDLDLLNMVHPNVKIIRVPITDLSKFTKTTYGKIKYIINNSAGDNFLNAWKENVFIVIEDLIKSYAPKAIITTCPPFSSAILSRDISKKFNLPFVLDMRDAWSEWSMVPQASYLHYLRKKKIENSVFKQAKKIISVTPQLISKLKKNHPSVDPEKFELIYNSPNFPVDDSFSFCLNKIENLSKINIGYTGTFYYSPKKKFGFRKPHQLFQYFPVKENWLYRTPYFFFKCLNSLFVKHPDWKKKFFLIILVNQQAQLIK